MSKDILFIDGENLLHKVEEVFQEEGIDKNKTDLAFIDLNKLLQEQLKGFTLSRKIIYVARLHIHPKTKKKSEELIKFQRRLRNNLVNQGYEFIIAGNVRAQRLGNRTIFREKGVDVKIGVDLVSLACNRQLKTAILCSSDSDLQPAIAELRKREVEVIYLGFETNPNKGLMYTTDRTILLRNPEVIEACNIKKIINGHT